VDAVIVVNVGGCGGHGADADVAFHYRTHGQV
jgi:hypothetical protein